MEETAIDPAFIQRYALAHDRDCVVSDDALVVIASEVNYMLKTLVEQARKFAVHARRRRLCGEDLDAALAMHEIPPTFGFVARELLPFRFAGSTGRDLFLNGDEKELELTAVINVNPPKLPPEPSLKAHWLVIEGTQPAVPENPAPPRDTCSPTRDESQLPSMTARRVEHVQMKAVTTHALSLEEQVYYKEILEACLSLDDTRRLEALHSLRTEAGLQSLLPRFALAIAEGVRCNIVQRNLPMLKLLMRVAKALVENVHVSLERVLHELLPAVLSCIVSRRVCEWPSKEDHWSLREFAGRLLGALCRAYPLSGARSRITQLLTSAWCSEDSEIETLYGALFALNELGVDTVEAVVVPRLEKMHARIVDALSATGSDKMATRKLRSLIVEVLAQYVRAQRAPVVLRTVADYREYFHGFGDALFRAINPGQPQARPPHQPMHQLMSSLSCMSSHSPSLPRSSSNLTHPSSLSTLKSPVQRNAQNDDLQLQSTGKTNLKKPAVLRRTESPR